MRRIALFLLAVAAPLVNFAGTTAIAAPVPKHLFNDAEADKLKLQGRWKLESGKSGKEPLRFVDAEMVWELRGDNVTTSYLGETFTGRLKLDTQSGVKRLHVVGVQRIEKDGKATAASDGAASLSYVLDGDSLTFAVNEDEKDRTVPDPAKPGEKTITLRYIRLKDQQPHPAPEVGR